MNEKEKKLLADDNESFEGNKIKKYINELEKALDKACEELSKTYNKITCGEHKETCTLPFCAEDTCCYSRKLTKEEWKEWAKEDE